MFIPDDLQGGRVHPGEPPASNCGVDPVQPSVSQQYAATCGGAPSVHWNAEAMFIPVDLQSDRVHPDDPLASSGGGGPVQPSVSQQNSIVADCVHPCDQPACGGSDGHVLPSFVQSISSALPQGDRQKLLLARDALSSEAGFESATALPDDVQQCVRWLAHKSDEQVMAERIS